MEVDNSNSPQTRNNLIPISEINNLLDSIVKIEYLYIKKKMRIIVLIISSSNIYLDKMKKKKRKK